MIARGRLALILGLLLAAVLVSPPARSQGDAAAGAAQAATAAEESARQMGEFMRAGERYLRSGGTTRGLGSCECLPCIASRAARARQIASAMDAIVKDPHSQVSIDPNLAVGKFHDYYRQIVRETVVAAPVPDGCVESVELSTDPRSCYFDPDAVQSLRDAVSCDQLAWAALAHEMRHQADCAAAAQDGDAPFGQSIPALAVLERDAHRAEADMLDRYHEKSFQECRQWGLGPAPSTLPNDALALQDVENDLQDAAPLLAGASPPSPPL